MSICYTPLKAWYDEDYNIVFKESIGHIGPFELPCGRCIGCRLEKRRQWAIRCVHESQFHDENCFITLTYDDDNLPDSNSLVKSDIQKFFKRLRKKINKKIKTLYCGEYGDKFGRPHYHAIIFGHEFGLNYKKHLTRHGDALKKFLDCFEEKDKNLGKKIKLFKTTEFGDIYCSEELDAIWNKGFTSVAEMSFHTANYVAKYLTKKISGNLENEHYKGRLPDFGESSRREGIGKKWIEKYYQQVIIHGCIIYENQKIKIPGYYEKWIKENKPSLFEILKIKREGSAPKVIGDRKKYDKLKIERKRFKELHPGEDLNEYDLEVFNYYKENYYDKKSNINL